MAAVIGENLELDSLELKAGAHKDWDFCSDFFEKLSGAVRNLKKFRAECKFNFQEVMEAGRGWAVFMTTCSETLQILSLNGWCGFR